MPGREPRLASPDTNPSFSRGLFAGEIREDLVFPFPEPSAEERESLRAILDAFRSFAAATIDARKHDHDERCSDETRAGMHEPGLTGLKIPEVYGGFFTNSSTRYRVLEYSRPTGRPR